MKLKTPTGTIQLGEWTKIKCYWLRQDLSEPRSDWARKFGHNNSVGFLIENGSIRFFGEDVNFLIDKMGLLNPPLPLDVDTAKQMMDNFLRLISE